LGFVFSSSNGLPNYFVATFYPRVPAGASRKKVFGSVDDLMRMNRSQLFLIRARGRAFRSRFRRLDRKRPWAIGKAAPARPNKSSPSRIHSDTSRRYEQKHLLHNWSNCRYRNRAQTARSILGIRLLVSSCCPESSLLTLPGTAAFRCPVWDEKLAVFWNSNSR
jgi:hypothetical protein